MAESTKPKSATSFKETAFGILPRSKIIIALQKTPPFYGGNECCDYSLPRKDRWKQEEGFSAALVNLNHRKPRTFSPRKFIKLEAEGIKRAQQYILKVSNKKVSITSQLILDLHRAGFGFIFPDWTGKFRKIDVTVGEYEPPHFSKISEFIQNLCNDLTERLKHLPPTKNEGLFLAELISLLAWFQHRFVWIHPFNDYNGRISRLLTNLLLLNLGFPIITIKAETGQDRDKYVEAMQAADNFDFTKLENLLAQALKTSLQKVSG